MQTEINNDSVKSALERTDDVLAGLRERLDDPADGTARELYERASARQRSAWESFAAGELRRALANTKVARNLASTALRRLNDGQIQ
jgi:hypothetical protein